MKGSRAPARRYPGRSSSNVARTPDTVASTMRRVVARGYLAAAAALLALAVIGLAVDGRRGVWGAALGLLVPVLFLSVTAVVLLLTARAAPGTLGIAVLGSWLVKLVVFALVLAALRAADFYHRGMFVTGFVVGLVGYLAVEAVVVVRSRVPYVEPEGSNASGSGRGDPPSPPR